MRACHFAAKFQAASAVASVMLIAVAARAASPSQTPHKKSHAKAHVQHASHASLGSSHANTASAQSAAPPPPPAPQQIVASLNGSAGDRALEPENHDRASSDIEPLRHRAALTLNPIPMIVGRFGANLELMLASHHAVVASGFVQTYSSAVMHVIVPQADMSNLPSPLFGGELGYRLYSGSEGPSGLFVGPSLVMMPFAYPHVGSDLRAEMVAFETYGAALDVGAQAVIGSGLTIGCGVGVQYLAYDPPASIAPPPGASVPSYPEPHVLPRVLLAAGWAF
ncbi:MAG: hypothetical protein ACRELY_02555 [Polyangiaceae bacterium]